MLPMTHRERFEALGVQPPKGVLLYGAPGTGKTLLARACAAQTKSTFLKLAGPQLVQMFIGDGAKMVRDAFAMAKEKAPAIIFIDELDAIGTKVLECVCCRQSMHTCHFCASLVGGKCVWRAGVVGLCVVASFFHPASPAVQR